MKDLFVPAELALNLKEKGFDKPCLAYWDAYNGAYHLIKHSEDRPWSRRFFFTLFNWKINDTYIGQDYIEYLDGVALAPVWQQAFYFFNENYKLASHTDLKSTNNTGDNYYYKIVNYVDFIDESTTLIVDGFASDLEAKNACLERLIKYIS